MKIVIDIEKKDGKFSSTNYYMSESDEKEANALGVAGIQTIPTLMLMEALDRELFATILTTLSNDTSFQQSYLDAPDDLKLKMEQEILEKTKAILSMKMSYVKEPLVRRRLQLVFT
jgi:hypothetical protein